MARPVTIDHERLLRIAREIFLEKGMTATTGEVARRAGIAQGSIFRRFESKAALFRAAMLSVSFPWMDSLRERVQKKGLKQALTETGVDIVALYRKVLPIAMMSWSHRGAFGAHKPFDEFPPALRSVFAFFGEQMEAGRLRKGDPQMVAITYVAPLMAYALGDVVGRKQLKALDAYVADAVDLLWTGIAPQGRTR